MKTLEQIDYLRKQLGIRDSQVLEEIINSYTNAQASLHNQLVKQQQRIDKAIEQLEEILEMAKDYGEVNLVDRLEIILKTLRGENNENYKTTYN